MNRLRQIRERKSLSTAQVSARTSIPIRLLTDYEAGTVEITPTHLKALAKALWVKPDEIMPPAGAEQPAPVASPAPQTPPQMPPQPPQPVEHRPAPPAQQSGFAPRPYQQAPAPGSFAPQHPRPASPPPPRSAPAGSFASEGPRGGGGGGSRSRTRQPVPLPATEGQVTEIMRLAARLNLSTDQLTAKFDRNMADLSRFDAREWIKVLREEAMTKAPPAKVHFGQWPGLKDDLEAVYLNELRTGGTAVAVTLFNGQVFTGLITDFTPYTITVAAGEDGPVVLRKLAVAYYKSTGESVSGDGTAKPERDLAPFSGTGAPAFATPNGNGSAEAPAEVAAAEGVENNDES